MSLNHFTQYSFSVEHGITGTLATDPAFKTTSKGKEYAQLVVYCKSQDDPQRSTGDEITLMAYVNIFRADLFNDVEKLNTGYFVNFKFSKVAMALGEDPKTGTLHAKAFVVAEAFEIKHVPQKAKAHRASDQSRAPREASTRSAREYRSRR